MLTISAKREPIKDDKMLREIVRWTVGDTYCYVVTNTDICARFSYLETSVIELIETIISCAEGS